MNGNFALITGFSGTTKVEGGLYSSKLISVSDCAHAEIPIKMNKVLKRKTLIGWIY
ncbi:MAG: hypothetical protein Sapg2KO_38660 [Saprospiraceae bacterium]